MFESWIKQCAQQLGPTPRNFSIWDRYTYLRVARPEWLYQSPQDKLETFFLNRVSLWKNGRVVWGHIVQANNQLFSPGRYDCPGEVVYSMESNDSIAVNDLASVASKIFELKHSKVRSPSTEPIAQHLENQMTRVFGMPVPDSMGPPKSLKISTVYFVRKHLPKPKRCLEKGLMPLLVHPESPHVAMIVPSRYWPVPFQEWWCG